MIAKKWVGFVMVAALGSAAACAEQASDEAVVTARSGAAESGGFVPHGEGYRAESSVHRVDIADGVIAMAPRALLPSSRRAGRDPRASTATVQSLSVTLETVAVHRGATALDVSVLQSSLVAPDLVETVRADFVELLRNTSTGAEQSWQFDVAPGSQGDLLVEVSAAAVNYVGESSAGLTFERPGVLRMTYGHGTWIDADGDRWSIPARFTNGHIALTVPSAVLSSSSYPAVLDPQIVVTPIGNVVGPESANLQVAPQIIVTPIGGPPPAGQSDGTVRSSH